jgi:hypothetical protein
MNDRYAALIMDISIVNGILLSGVSFVMITIHWFWFRQLKEYILGEIRKNDKNSSACDCNDGSDRVPNIK